MNTLEIEYRQIDDLIPYVNNSRTHSDEQVTQVASSIKEFGFTNPILVDDQGGIIAGHGRLMAARKLGMDEVPTIVLGGLSDAQRKAYVIADNKLALNSGWDEDLLKIEIEELGMLDFDLGLLGFDDGELDSILGEIEPDPYAAGEKGKMSLDFGQPPFSVLDTRKGDWLERKRYWRTLIGDNGESREGTLAEDSIMSDMNNGVSLLDPVLAEIMVAWFGTKEGLVIDPFAGDTVFGYVAGSLGMGFEGIELRKEQCDLNQARTDSFNLPCKYFNDTSENIDKYISDDSADMVFSCPPYADLEVYSDDPRDLSTMSHGDFFATYKSILQSTFSKLKNNRFAVIVMGEVRGKDGSYIGTIPKTIQLMEEAGYKYYNEIILINSAGTLPLRAGKSMRATRKVGKMHQNILVFCKGDPSIAAKEIGEIEIDMSGGEE
jgi:16S rRNA G966 N2-methylase RsmD